MIIILIFLITPVFTEILGQLLETESADACAGSYPKLLGVLLLLGQCLDRDLCQGAATVVAKKGKQIKR